VKTLCPYLDTIHWDLSPYICENIWRNDSDWQSHSPAR
jgi:hypothetical protein